jgi:hypothetical protein
MIPVLVCTWRRKRQWRQKNLALLSNLSFDRKWCPTTTNGTYTELGSRLVLMWPERTVTSRRTVLNGHSRYHQVPDGLHKFNVWSQYTSTRASRATAWHTEGKFNFARLDYEQARQLPLQAHGIGRPVEERVWKKKMCSHIFFFPVSTASTLTKLNLPGTWRQ